MASEVLVKNNLSPVVATALSEMDALIPSQDSKVLDNLTDVSFRAIVISPQDLPQGKRTIDACIAAGGGWEMFESYLGSNSRMVLETVQLPRLHLNELTEGVRSTKHFYGFSRKYIDQGHGQVRGGYEIVGIIVKDLPELPINEGPVSSEDIKNTKPETTQNTQQTAFSQWILHKDPDIKQ